MYGKTQRRRGRRAILAATLLAGVAATPARAEAAAGTANFDGGSVALVRTTLPDGWMDGAMWVGRADGTVMVDPALDCLNGVPLDVFIRTGSRSLVFTNVSSTADCVATTLHAVVPTPVIGDDLAPCTTSRCLDEQVSFRFQQATQAAMMLADSTLGNVESADELVTGMAATTKAASVVSALAGEVVAQYMLLSELSGAYFAVDPMSLSAGAYLIVNGQTMGVSTPVLLDAAEAVGCLTNGCPVLRLSSALNESSSGESPHVQPRKFEFCNSVKPYWANRDSKHGVYGDVIYNMWCLPDRVSNENDFYATSQDASVTPEHKSRLNKIWSTWESNSNGIRIVEAQPRSMSSSGQGETITYDASLSGNVSAKKDGTGGEIGAQFGISRSYTRPNHNHGGGAYGGQGHYVQWETGDNGSGYGKQAAGVETWVIPVGSTAGFIWNAHAWWCNDPCGP